MEIKAHDDSGTTVHVEQLSSRPAEAIPDDYYKSKLFIGTTAAVAISLVCVSFWLQNMDTKRRLTFCRALVPSLWWRPF